jgi:hypothetical protein
MVNAWWIVQSASFAPTPVDGSLQEVGAAGRDCQVWNCRPERAGTLWDGSDYSAAKSLLVSATLNNWAFDATVQRTGMLRRSD